MATDFAAFYANGALSGPSLQDKTKALKDVNVPPRMMYRVLEVLLEDTAVDYTEGGKRVGSLLALFKK
ncbi:hypothetical protein GN244_ATG12059 [Phytophthora infestans]|uniref:Uncharacterized protein n=1 Tax=Phytophthora infestans TaxID=4787 RepID=A0A833WSW7_PHYIN|nr:hypothetical protein GN244_ATG12059 [Phytophthora infestans]